MNNIPDKIDIDIEIAVSDVISHPLNKFPRDLTTQW